MSSPVQEAAQSQSRAQIRSLQHDLLGARDQQILRVVDMVDKMPQRGDADDFIAPLRPRLAFLRPIRRLNFTRLLFQPLDSVIVARRAAQRAAAPGHHGARPYGDGGGRVRRGACGPDNR